MQKCLQSQHTLQGDGRPNRKASRREDWLAWYTQPWMRRWNVTYAEIIPDLSVGTTVHTWTHTDIHRIKKNEKYLENTIIW